MSDAGRRPGSIEIQKREKRVICIKSDESITLAYEAAKEVLIDRSVFPGSGKKILKQLFADACGRLGVR